MCFDSLVGGGSRLCFKMDVLLVGWDVLDVWFLFGVVRADIYLLLKYALFTLMSILGGRFAVCCFC